MQKELECIKIKDGLYLGNITTAQDAEFLVTNKFSYVVNCSSEVPNYYEGQGVKYLKFKLNKEKSHKLWDESLKKLKKLDKFIQSSEQSSMCCLIHSYDGINRSLVMLTAFLMHRYCWKLGKTLQFVRSKQIFIGLSQHYIDELQKLQRILQANNINLSSEWKIQYRTTDEQILSKTYLNSQEVQFVQPTKRQKKTRRIVWQDVIQKQKDKKKQQKLISKDQKQKSLKMLVYANSENDQKSQAKQLFIKKKKKGQQQVGKDKVELKRPKIPSSKTKSQVVLRQTQKINKRSLQKLKQSSKQVNMEDHYQENIINMIKKNFKQKKIDINNNDDQNQNLERVYNVTINNFIKPNINILGVVDKKKTKKRPQSAWKKSKPL